MTFLQLRDYVLRLRNDQRTTEDEANRTLRRVRIQAGRLIYDYCVAGSPGFTIDLSEYHPSSDPDARDVEFEVLWDGVTTFLSRHHGALMPNFGDADIRCANKAPGVRAYTMSFPPDRWRQRAEDYAAGLTLLAKLAGEEMAAPGAVQRGEAAKKPGRKPNRRSKEKALTNKQAAVVELHDVQNQTFAAIGRAWGKKTQGVQQLYERAKANPGYKKRRSVDLHKAKPIHANTRTKRDRTLDE